MYGAYRFPVFRASRYMKPYIGRCRTMRGIQWHLNRIHSIKNAEVISASTAANWAWIDYTPKHANGWAINSPSLVVDLPSHCVSNVFDKNEVELLTNLYCNLYKVQESTLTVSSTFEKYTSATINGLLFGSQKTCTTSSSIVIANWDSELFGSPSNLTGIPRSNHTYRAAKINYFCKHNIEVKGEAKTHLSVYLS